MSKPVGYQATFPLIRLTSDWALGPLQKAAAGGTELAFPMQGNVAIVKVVSPVADGRNSLVHRISSLKDLAARPPALDDRAYGNESGRISPSHATVSHGVDTSSRSVTGLLRALKVSDEFSSKRDKEKVKEGIRGVVQALINEGLVTLPVMPLISQVSWKSASEDEERHEEILSPDQDLKTQIFNGEEMLTVEPVAKKLGISRQGVWGRWRAKQLIGLKNSGREVRYPAWQFESAVSPHVPRLLAILPGRDRSGWEVFLFMTNENPILNDESPLEALRSGDVDRVYRAAEAYRFEMT